MQKIHPNYNILPFFSSVTDKAVLTRQVRTRGFAATMIVAFFIVIISAFFLQLAYRNLPWVRAYSEDEKSISAFQPSTSATDGVTSGYIQK